MPTAMPAGTVYARSNTNLYAIDARTGATTITPITLVTTVAVSMVAIEGGVIIRPLYDSPGLLIRDGQTPTDLPGLLKHSADVLPGPKGHLWALTQATTDNAEATATLVDERGRRHGPRLTSTGSYHPDGNGGLLLSDTGGTWQAYPTPIRRVSTGRVTAVGQRHYQSIECDESHTCTEVLIERRSGHRTTLSPRDRSHSAGLLSPDGTLSANLDGPLDTTGLGTSITRLSDNTVVQQLPNRPDAATSQPILIAWISSRWLAAITDGRLVLYDTTADHVTTPSLPAEGILQVTWRPS